MRCNKVKSIDRQNGESWRQFFRHCLLFTFITRFYLYCSILFVLLFLSLNAFSQPGGEIGVIGGGGYYLGEYNPSSHFKGTQPYIGGFYRYNLNDRFAFRLNAGFSKIDAKRALLDNDGVTYPAGFKSSVKDISLLVEFNFRSFLVPKTDKSSFWSPYIFTGFGLVGSDDEGSISIPGGIGVKFNLVGGLSCGIEWGARKLFTDKLDGLEDPWNTKESNFLYNKDWFFVTGFTLSYRFPMNQTCFGYQ